MVSQVTNLQSLWADLTHSVFCYADQSAHGLFLRSHLKEKGQKLLGKGVFIMNYIAEAREAVSSYNVIGGVSLCDMQNILAVLIGSKSTPELTGKLAAIGIKKLVEMTISELKEVGLSNLQAQTVHAGCLMARTLKNTSRDEQRYTIRSPKDSAMFLMDELSDIKQEHFVAVYLNIKNQVIHKETIFVGSLNASIVSPREIFRTGVKYSAASMVVYHSHPSGVCQPSQEDIAVTKRLKECGSLMGIELLDHIIIGDRNYISLNEKGYM